MLRCTVLDANGLVSSESEVRGNGFPQWMEHQTWPGSDPRSTDILHIRGFGAGLRVRDGLLQFDLDEFDPGEYDEQAASPLGLNSVRAVCVVLDACADRFSDVVAALFTAGVAVVVLPNDLGAGNAAAFAAAFYGGLRGAGTATVELAPADLRTAFQRGSEAAGPLPDDASPLLHDPRTGSVSSPLGIENRVPRHVRVWFGTNRAPREPTGYGRAATQELSLGRCDVRVLEPVGWDQPSAALGRAGVERTDGLSRTAFNRELAAAIGAQASDVLMYVHGYNTSFDAAACHAAQLHTDLRFPGMAAMFSWPSRGQLRRYFSDEDAVQQAERFLYEYLRVLTDHGSVGRLHVLAHSMGNRALLRAVMRAVDRQDESFRLGHVLLAAADVGQSFFAQEGDCYTAVSESATMYVSLKDRALRSSRIVHNVARAGLTPPVTTIRGIDTVSVEAIDVTLLGHGYFREALPVIRDMRRVLDGTPPAERIAVETHSRLG